jgi:hypothetical protein
MLHNLFHSPQNSVYFTILSFSVQIMFSIKQLLNCKYLPGRFGSGPFSENNLPELWKTKVHYRVHTSPANSPYHGLLYPLKKLHAKTRSLITVIHYYPWPSFSFPSLTYSLSLSHTHTRTHARNFGESLC